MHFPITISLFTSFLLNLFIFHSHSLSFSLSICLYPKLLNLPLSLFPSLSISLSLILSILLSLKLCQCFQSHLIKKWTHSQTHCMIPRFLNLKLHSNPVRKSEISSQSGDSEIVFQSVNILMICSYTTMIFKNVSSSTSHKKNSETVKIWDSRILAFSFLAHSFMNQFWKKIFIYMKQIQNI